jgi:anti-anti-sigma factor
VKGLADRLTADGFDVFFDEWFIGPGHHIHKVLLAALRKSRTVLACMTPGYFQSKWTDFELNWNFVDTQLASAGAEPRLIPAMLRTCEVPKEMMVRRRVDLTGDDYQPGYGDLAAALSTPDSLLVEAYPVPPGSRGRYVADFVAGKLRAFFEFPERRLREFLTVYAELVQNAVDHATGAIGPVEVNIRVDREQVLLEVTDAGPGFDLAGRLQAAGHASADPTAVGVRGLQLVEALCDRLSSGTRNGRHVVTALLRREKSVRQAARLADALATRPGEAESAGLRAASGPWFVWFVEPAGRYAYVSLNVERIDQHNADSLQSALAQLLNGRSFSRVIVDCSAVVYVSSVGLRVLMLLAKQVRSTGGTTALIVTHPLLEEILQISRFDMVVQIFRSVEDALKALG